MITEELIEFIRKTTFIERMPVTETTLLVDEIGISGDDAIDFLEKFSKRFDVDISAFDFMKYFNDEGEVSISILDYWLGNKKNRTKNQLTVGDLQKAVLAGKLDDTVIGS